MRMPWPCSPAPVPGNPAPGAAPRRLAARHHADHWLPLLAWCLWLMANWAIARPTSQTRPAVDWMLSAIVLGMMGFWPAWRLSQDTGPTAGDEAQAPAGRWGAWSAWREAGCLWLVLQSVLWTLRLVAPWSVEQAGWLDATIGVWAALVAAVVAWGVGGASMTAEGEKLAGARRRTWAMMMIVAILLGGWLWRGLGLPAGNGWARVLLEGPLTAVRHMGRPAGSWVLGGRHEEVWVVAAAALLAWGLVAAAAMMGGATPGAGEPVPGSVGMGARGAVESRAHPSGP